jgi:hypothetical protein
MRYDLEIRAPNCYCDFAVLLSCRGSPQQYGIESGALATDFDLIQATRISIKSSLVKQFTLRYRNDVSFFWLLSRFESMSRFVVLKSVADSATLNPATHKIVRL